MISIITPSFNRAYIIDDTAQSIFNQSSENWEWVVVDDGSTDGSWEKLQSFARQNPRVRVFQRDREPKGAGTCRNIGVEKAHGNHLVFLDSDDILGRDAIASRFDWIRKSKSNSILYFPVVTFAENPDSGYLWDDAAHPVSWLTGLFTMTPPCQGTAPLWPREEFLRVGSWREDLKVWQDIELHIRAYVKGVRFNPVDHAKPDIFLRLSPDSISHVNFHSPEKTMSRWEVVRYCLEQFSVEALSVEELQSLQKMVLGVFHNALQVRDFQLAKDIIRHCSNGTIQTARQLEWMRMAQRIWRWRLYKIQLLNQILEKQRNEVISLSLHRRICSIPWNMYDSTQE